MKKSMIYTKTGDKGTTSLVGGTRVPKTHIRLEAYGTVDELNSYLGLLQTYLTDEEDKQIIFRIQNKLFSVGSYLATDQTQTKLRMESRIEDEDIRMLEQAIDVIDNELPPLNAFILPGGDRGAAVGHICRTVCRRAERRILALAEECDIDARVTAFVNRLSDYLFILTRKLNHFNGGKHMKTKAKIIIAAVLAIAISIGSIAIYKHITGPKEESIPLETTLEDAAELTTQKMIISDVFRSTKGEIPLINKNRFLVQYKTTVTAGLDVQKAVIKETDDKIQISIPHCTVNEDSIKIKSSDLKIYDTNFAIMSIDKEAVMELVAEAEKKAKEKAGSDEYGFLENADKNAKKVIKGMFENVSNGKEVIVSFQN